MLLLPVAPAVAAMRPAALAPPTGVVAQAPEPTPLFPTDVPTDLDPLSPAAVPPSSSAPAPTPSSATPTPAPSTEPSAGTGSVPAPSTGASGRDDGDGRAGLVLMLLALVASTLVGARALRRMLHAWWSPQDLAATRFMAAPPGSSRAPRVSVLVPARHEEAVLAETLDRLAASDHRDLQVLVVVGDDDPATTAVARAAASRHRGRVQVVVDRTLPRSKQAALGAGLARATGEVVAVFDAEDDVHPQLVSAAVAHLAATGAGLLQTGVQQVTAERGWWALRACLGDHFRFRSELHALAGSQAVPPAGTGVFYQRTLLKEVRGWDADVMGDADMGLRLQARGALAAVAYEPALTTREETPAGVGAFVRQRTRRDQGALQVLRRRRSRELATGRQRRVARGALAAPFVDAVLAPVPLVVLVLALMSLAPAWVAALALVPLTLSALRLVVEDVGLRQMGREHGIPVGPRDHLVLALSAAPYRLLLVAAAARALGRELVGRRAWLATEHTGAHRPATPQPSVTQPSTPQPSTPSVAGQQTAPDEPQAPGRGRRFPFPLARSGRGRDDAPPREGLIDLRDEILGPLPGSLDDIDDIDDGYDVPTQTTGDADRTSTGAAKDRR
ncbi:MAG TPA: glycosyltransferase [Actinomycetales bacterium]